MSHRRYLPTTHRWRNDKESFDSTKERGLPLNYISSYNIFDQVQDLDGMILTKAASKQVKISHKSRGDNWNKKSIFFEFSY